MPLISVIAGAYDINSYYSLDKSINSILSQTFGDFEFIICDDGSQDNTWDILSQYAARDSRIKLLRNGRNLGLAASLNRCIETSSGEFIARHDLDDYCDEQRFARQLAFLQQYKDVGALGCQAFLFDSNGIWGKADFPAEVTDRDFLFNSPFMHGSVIFRREALLAAGCYRVSRETYRMEDYDLFMTMQHICRCANLPDRLYYYCEDAAARKRRKYRYRIDEARVRFRGFKKLGLLPRGIPYVVKPLVVGLIPTGMLEKLKDAYYKRKR